MALYQWVDRFLGQVVAPDDTYATQAEAVAEQLYPSLFDVLAPLPPTVPAPQAEPRVLIRVTGFGPFGETTDNPTQRLVEALRERQQQEQQQQQKIAESEHSSSPFQLRGSRRLDSETDGTPSSSTGGCSCQLETSILEVSMKAVDAYLSGHAAENDVDTVVVDDTDDDKREKETQLVILINLHLGVNNTKTGTNVQLETTAYNQAHFRIPDQQGFQPQQQLIDTGCDDDTEDTDVTATKLDQPIKTMTTSTLPTTTLGQNHDNDTGDTDDDDPLVVELCRELQLLYPPKEGSSKENKMVQLSNDPGRFVCNYLYYKSLKQQQKQQHSSSSTKQTQPTIATTLFVHVPPFEAIPFEIQFDFLNDLMALLVSLLQSKLLQQQQQQ